MWVVVVGVLAAVVQVGAAFVARPASRLAPLRSPQQQQQQVPDRHERRRWSGGFVLRSEADTNAEAQSLQSTAEGRVLGEKLKGTNVYLVGMMGSGKTSVGEALTRMIGSYRYIDTDSTLETAANATCGEIFALEGEDKFRDLEAMILNQVAAFVRLVVGTGGGIVLKTQNWAALRSGIVIWLNPTLDVLEARFTPEEREMRPLLKDQGFEVLQKILDDRRKLYDQADVIIDVDDASETPTQTAKRLIKDVLEFIEKNPPLKPPTE